MEERKILITPEKTEIKGTGEDLINAIAQLEYVLFKEVPEDAQEEIKQAIFRKRLMLDIDELVSETMEGLFSELTKSSESNELKKIIGLLKKMERVL